MEKRFHFQELNWVITFPKSENCGKKYPDYLVQVLDLKYNVSTSAVLIDVVEKTEFQEGFPLTVGFYKTETTESFPKEMRYLELRIIRSIEDFWKFLNDLDL